MSTTTRAADKDERSSRSPSQKRVLEMMTPKKPDVQPDLPTPPDQQPHVPVTEPPGRPHTSPDGPVDEPTPTGPVRQ